MESLKQRWSKAHNQLFSQIDSELKEKENFLKDQSSKINEMVKMYDIMIAKICVLKSAA